MFNLFENLMKLYEQNNSDISLHERILYLEEKVKNLEEENIETNNLFYEILNSIDALDVRIDILVGEKFISKESSLDK